MHFFNPKFAQGDLESPRPVHCALPIGNSGRRFFTADQKLRQGEIYQLSADGQSLALATKIPLDLGGVDDQRYRNYQCGIAAGSSEDGKLRVILSGVLSHDYIPLRASVGTGQPLRVLEPVRGHHSEG